MVPETIDWENVRCLSLDNFTIRFLVGEVEHEIVFPSETALREALRRWTVQSEKATQFFRRHDFRSVETQVEKTTAASAI